MRHPHSISHSIPYVLKLLCALFLFGGISQAVHAEQITSEQIKTQLTQLAKSDSLSESDLNAAQDLLQQALTHLEQAESWQRKQQEIAETAQKAPDLIPQLNNWQPVEVSIDERHQDSSLVELETLIFHEQSTQKSLSDQIDELRKKIENRDARRKEISLRITELESLQKELQDQSPPQLDTDESPEVTQAKQTVRQAQLQNLTAEQEALRSEIASFDLQGNLLNARYEKLNREHAMQEQYLSVLREFYNQRQQEAAQDAVDSARDLVDESSLICPNFRDLLSSLANENEELVEEQTGPHGLLAKIGSTSTSLKEIEAELAGLKQRFESIQTKINTVGLTDVLGMLLRNERRDLLQLKSFKQQHSDRRDEISDVQMRLIVLRENRMALTDLSQAAANLSDPVINQATQEINPDCHKIISELLTAKRNLLDQLIRDYGNYLVALVNLDSEQKEVAEIAKEFLNYIDQRVLWIRSNSTIDLRNLWRAMLSAGKSASQTNWLLPLAAVWWDFWNNLPLYLIVILYMVFGGRLRKIVWAMLDQKTRRPYRRELFDFIPILLDILYCLGTALFYPVLVIFIGWRLNVSLFSEEIWVAAIGQGLIRIALILYFFEFLRYLLVAGERGKLALSWPQPESGIIQRHIKQVEVVLLLVIFIYTIFQGSVPSPWKDTLSRYCHLIAALLATVWVYRFFDPNKGPVRQLQKKLSPGSRHTIIRVGQVVLLVCTISVFLLNLQGYVYSSIRLSNTILVSLGVVIIAILIYSLLLMGVQILRKKHVIEDLKSESNKKSDDHPSSVHSVVPFTLEEDSQHELMRIDAETRVFLQWFVGGLLTFTLWHVWSEILPAVQLLNRIELWQSHQTVSQTVLDSAGKSVLEAREMVQPVTVVNLIIAGVIAAFGWTTAQNLPGLIDFTVLKRTTLGQGEKYAVKTIIRYLVVATTLILFFGSLGVAWSQLQWLVAALGVGLGFGLQEIFANFVSGLIILFERPVRVGDVITVGAISGVVSKIRMRATTITDFDRKELIVPNKEFVTGQMINWTHSDSVLRIRIKVGVAYGSDTNLVEKTLYQVAEDHPLVLKDPKPSVLFTGFGNSSLDFELRVYSPDLDVYLPLTHEMHMQVEKAFRKANIEIAFPQQDIHVRTIPRGLLGGEPPLSSSKENPSA